MQQSGGLDFELMKSGLDSVAEHMTITVMRTAYSTLIRDTIDFGTGLCNARGELVAQGLTVPLHLGSIGFAMKHHADTLRRRSKPGDVFLINDPYDAGTHLPDIFVIRPIFSGETLVAFAVVIAHQADIGGRMPGGVATDSRHIHEEGLRIPLVKLFREGERDPDVEEFIRRNVRVPDAVMGDLESQIAASRVGEAGILKLVEEWGEAKFMQFMEDLLDYTERTARSEIAAWPDGTYHFEDYIDGDGCGNERLNIRIALTVDGDRLVCDYRGSHRQVSSAINAVRSVAESCTFLSVRCAMSSDVANNGGYFRPIETLVDRGSLVSCDYPAAVASRGLTAGRLIDTCLGALANVAPERIPSGSAGIDSGITIWPSAGGRDVSVEFPMGGWGGRYDKDGVDAISYAGMNGNIQPVEEIESRHPLRIWRVGLIPDTGGRGRFRGSLSIEREYEFLEDEMLLQVRADRQVYPPYGLDGGLPGGPGRNELVTSGERLPDKFSRLMKAGERFRHVIAGSGGRGNPLERDPDAVLEDVRDGKITPDHAAEAYGVVIESDRVDVAATSKRRAALSAKSGGEAA